MTSLIIVFFLLFFPSVLSAVTVTNEEQIFKRVHAHMVIRDFQSAADEAYYGVQQYPHSKTLWQSSIRAIAKTGDEQLLMSQWKQFIKKFPEESQNQELLECLAWAVIEKGAISSSPIIRVTAMLGAFFSQDAKGVNILLRGLRDDNSFLRAAAIKLSSHLHDVSLQDELLRLFKEESVWNVRLEAIEAIGSLHLADSSQALKDIIALDSSHIDEKTAAIKALTMLSDSIDKEQLNCLVRSNRVGMRLLACELLAHFDQKQDVDVLSPFLYDYHASVRAKVFQTLGNLRVERLAGHSVTEVAARGVVDPDPLVAITAAWLLMLNDSRKGEKAFEKLLQHDNKDMRILAAAALASTGKYGLPLLKKAFNDNDNIFVKMNLAIGLIGQRTNVKQACDCLYNGLTQNKERWNWEEQGNFRILAPSKVKHNDAIPNYPEAVNQTTRLEVLEILSMVQYPAAQQAIKLFLQETNWDLCGLASVLLLTEGDDNAVDLIKALLQDNDPKVRMQAALILALWGKGEDTIQLLQASYSSADRELRGKILEAIGRVGSRVSLQFLSQCLQEPYQTLRIIAAAALLECLYH